LGVVQVEAWREWERKEDLPVDSDDAIKFLVVSILHAYKEILQSHTNFPVQPLMCGKCYGVWTCGGALVHA
jgi:hypothetical protein